MAVSSALARSTPVGDWQTAIGRLEPDVAVLLVGVDCY